MKKILLLSLFISTSLVAQEDCEKTPIDNNLLSLALPNCLRDTYVIENPQSLCLSCGAEFTKKYTGPSIIKKADQQKAFLQLALDEYVKNVTNNLVEAAKMAALPNTGANFEKSIAACALRDVSQFTSQCLSPTAVSMLQNAPQLKDLERKLSNELARIISPKEENLEPCLLSRTEKQCSISEKEVLFLSSSAVEESFTPEIIDYIQKVDVTRSAGLQTLFQNPEFSRKFPSQAKELSLFIENHPLLNQYAKDTKSFVSFFKTLPTKDVAGLRKVLYSQKSGDEFDKKLAESCATSFDSLRKSVCSTNFESGLLDLRPAENYSKIVKEEFIEESEDFAHSDDLINKNIALLRFCPADNLPHKEDLLKLQGSITATMNSNYKDMTLDLFKEAKFDAGIGSTKKFLCDAKSKSCEQTSILCKIQEKYNGLHKNPNSLDAKLASSSNTQINTLLRGMIGDGKNIEVRAREILVANGVLPNEKGEIVSQDIPERKPDIYSNPAIANHNGAQTNVPSTSANSPLAAGQMARSQRTPASKTMASFENTTKRMVADKDFSDFMKEQMDESREIQNEIRRRLSDTSPVSEAEARDLARKLYEAKKRPVTNDQVQAMAQTIQSQQPVYAQAHSPFGSQTTTTAPTSVSGTGAKLPEGRSKLQEWRDNSMNRALADMKGARSLLKSNSDLTERPKDLTKVALNVLENPDVTLSEVLNQKLSANDTETQILKVLMRKKNDFLLSVKSANFKIIFDEKMNFNLLYVSGDKTEAQRLRPQIELFLKQLKV